MTPILLIASIFIAALMQTISGFGFALLVMPVAVHLVGLHTAAPLIALVALTLYAVNLIRFRRSLDWSELKRLGWVAAAGVPVGVWALTHVDEAIVQRGLGLVLSAYALYALFSPTPLASISRWWAYPAGFLAGCLGGAYNIPGPPLILYGSLRQWPHQRFRAVLQAVFLVNAIIVVSSHVLAGNMTQPVRSLYLLVAPFLLLGVTLAAYLDHRLPAQSVRIFALVLIFILGLTLLF